MDPKDSQPQAGAGTQPVTDQPAPNQAAVDATQQQTEAPMQPAAAQPPVDATAQPVDAQSNAGQPLEVPGSSSLEQPATETVATPQQTQQPAAPQQNMGGFGHVDQAGKKQQMIKRLVMVVAAIVVIGVIGLVIQSLLSGGKVGNLVADSQDGMSFMRPEKWVMADSDDEFTYFTEEGATIDNVDLGLLLGSEQFDFSYDSLSEEEKQIIKSSFESQFASLDSTLTDGSCAELDEITSNEVAQQGYDLAFSINATCAKLQGKETGGTVKMILGLHNDQLHIFGVVADDATWESDGEKLDEIVASVSPTE